MCEHHWQSKVSDLSGRKGVADLESNGENWQKGTPLTRTGYISNSQFGSLTPLGVNSGQVDIDHSGSGHMPHGLCLFAQVSIQPSFVFKQNEK